MIRRPPVATLFPTTTLFESASADGRLLGYAKPMFIKPHHREIYPHLFERRRKPLVPSRLSRPVSRFTSLVHPVVTQYPRDRKSTRLNSSHANISYVVFCLKK